MWKLIEFCPRWPWFFFRCQCLGFETRSFFFEMMSNGHAFTKKNLKMHSYLQGTWNTCQKICTWWLTKKKSTWMQKEVMHNLIYTLHKTLNLWHSIGHQSQTLPEFNSETSRLFSTSSGLKTGFVHCWIATFEKKIEGLVFKRPQEETWHGFN